MKSFREAMGHFVMKYLVVPPLPKAQKGKRTIACIGDSITFGAGVRGRRRSTWEYFLEQKLGKEWQVLNYGISGRTLLSGGDYPYTAEKMYGASQRQKADVYLLMLGTNDSKPYNWDEKRYPEELKRFTDTYLGLGGRPKVVLMAPPFCFPDPAAGKVNFDILNETIGREVRNAIKETAGERDLQVIDLYEFSRDHSEWFCDGVHPNEAGNREIAEYIFQNLSF